MADYEKPPLSDIEFLRDLGNRLLGQANGMDAARDHAVACDIDSPDWKDWQGVYKGIRGEAEYALRLAHSELKDRCGF